MKIRIVAFSRRGCELAGRVKDVLGGHECRVYSKTAAEVTGTEKIEWSMSLWTEESFGSSDAIVTSAVFTPKRQRK